MKRDEERLNPEMMSSDQSKWYGPFYFNKKDLRIMVPKINPSLGATFNLASPYAIIILIFIFASIIFSALVTF